MGICNCPIGFVVDRFFFVHKLIPHDISSVSFAGININDHGFYDVRTFVYYFNVKFLTISLLSLWFISCQYWWRYAILSGIILNTYQLAEGIQENLMLIDEAEYFYSLPFILILILILITLSEAIRYHSKILDLYDNLKQEIEEILDASHSNTEIIQNRRKQFLILKNKTLNKVVKFEQLNALKKLKSDLINELKNLG